MKNTSHGGLGGVAMNPPLSIPGWWVGEGRGAPRRGLHVAVVREFEIVVKIVHRPIEDRTIDFESRF